MIYKIITLGCKVNTYESNVIDDLMKNNGYVKTANEDADIVIINTCTVTNTANNKSLKMIRHAVVNNPRAIIVVCGCAAQVYKDDILKIDGVDIVLGNIGKNSIVNYIEEFKKTKRQIVDVKNVNDIKYENMELNNFDKTRAFVKIQDGCNNFCSYCIIPYSRGSVRSRNKEDILDEIKRLILQGHSEIVLTGIHTGNYGAEFDNYKFSNLLVDILKIEGLKRLRISSIEITELNDNVLDVLRNNKVLVSHLHIPLQSGTDEILKLMNRKYDTNYFASKIAQIREIRPDISITTDVITGFPGETDEYFEKTVEFIKKIKFSKIHVFPYSKREGTKAYEYENHVSDVVKKNRAHILLELSKKLETRYMEKFINKDVVVIPEMFKNNFVIGHTDNYLMVKIKTDNFSHNELKVKIIDVNYPYCIGVL